MCVCVCLGVCLYLFGGVCVCVHIYINTKKNANYLFPRQFETQNWIIKDKNQFKVWNCNFFNYLFLGFLKNFKSHCERYLDMAMLILVEQIYNGQWGNSIILMLYLHRTTSFYPEGAQYNLYIIARSNKNS